MSLARDIAATLATSPAREAAVAAVAHDTGRLLVSLLRLREIEHAERCHLESVVRRAIDLETDPTEPDEVTDVSTVGPSASAASTEATPSVARGDAPMSPPPEQAAPPARRTSERQAPVEVRSPLPRLAPVASADSLPDMAGRVTAVGRLAHLKTATSAEQAESARQWPGYEGHRGTLDGEVERMAATHRRISELEGLGDIAGLVDLGDHKTTQSRPGLAQHIAAALERLRSAPTHDQPAAAVPDAVEAAAMPAASVELDLNAIEAPV